MSHDAATAVQLTTFSRALVQALEVRTGQRRLKDVPALIQELRQNLTVARHGATYQQIEAELRHLHSLGEIRLGAHVEGSGRHRRLAAV